MRSLKASDVPDDVISDHDLVQQLKNGNDQALNDIMQRYKAPLYKFAWRILGSENNAADIVQETFTRVYFNIQKFDANYKFSSWLYQIALNLCRDHQRKNRFGLLHVSLNNQDDQPDLPAPQIDMADALHARRQVMRLQTEIPNLPAKLREAFVLYAIEEKSQAECAEILGVSAKTIETRVYRARKILAQKIAK